MGAGAEIIATLEAAWAAIQHHHPEIPDVVIITGTYRQKGGDRWGHHDPERWQLAQAQHRQAELLTAGELLGKDAEAILRTLLHEATHALGHTRGVKDTSRGGRYHNKRFVQLAGELTLAPPAQAHPTYGWFNVDLTPDTRSRYQELLQRLQAASLAYRTDPEAILQQLDDLRDRDDQHNAEDGPDDRGRSGRRRRSRDGTRLAVACACDRRLQVTPKSLEDGPILCGLCGQPFEADDEEVVGGGP